MQLLAFDLAGVAGGLLQKTWMLQREYNWQLMMPFNLKGILGVFVSQYCQDATFPSGYSMSELSSIRYGAFQRFYAGLQEISSVNLSFIMPTDNTVFDFFKAWRELVVDKNGFYHPKLEYKKDIYLLLYDRTGLQSGKFTLKGVFPKTNPSFDVSYQKESVLRWGLELSVDRVESESLIGGILTTITGAIGNAVPQLGGINSILKP